MKNFILSLFDNFELSNTTIAPQVFFSKKIQLQPVYSFAFTGLTDSNKFIPSETEIVNFSNGGIMPEPELKEKEVRNVLEECEKTGANIGYVTVKRRSLWVWISSTAIILLIASSTVYFHVRNNEIDKLFYSYYAVPELSPAVFSNPGFANNKNWMVSLQAFNEKNFTLALDNLRNIENTTSEYDISRFLLSICLMQDNRVQDALYNFTALRGNSTLMPSVNWYTGLCYLKLGNINSAKVLFQDLTKQNNSFGKKAAEILRKINAVH